MAASSRTLNASGATPAMAQWFAAKEAHPDALVFFRMGDFYELFFADAEAAAAAAWAVVISPLPVPTAASASA